MRRNKALRSHVDEENASRELYSRRAFSPQRPQLWLGCQEALRPTDFLSPGCSGLCAPRIISSALSCVALQTLLALFAFAFCPPRCVPVPLRCIAPIQFPFLQPCGSKLAALTFVRGERSARRRVSALDKTGADKKASGREACPERGRWSRRVLGAQERKRTAKRGRLECESGIAAARSA